MAKKSYTFAELSDEARKKVIERERNTYLEGMTEEWSESVIENFKSYMEGKYGIEVTDVGYDVSYSQGSGASFTFDRQGISMMNEEIDKADNPFLLGYKTDDPIHEKVIKFVKEESIANGSVMIAECKRTTHQYQHENTVSAYVEADIYSIQTPYGQDELIDQYFTVADGWNKYDVLAPSLLQAYFKTPEDGFIEYDDQKKYDAWCLGADNKWYYVPFTYADLVRIANDYNIDSNLLNTAGFTRPTERTLETDIENYLEENDIFDIAKFIIQTVTVPTFAKEVSGEEPKTTEELLGSNPDVLFVPDMEKELEILASEMEENLGQIVIDESRQLYRDLEKEYEAATSDESIAEWLEVNDMDEYTEDGEIYYGDMPKLTYSELSGVAKNKLNSQYYLMYDFHDMNDAMISDKLGKIAELGFKNPRFEYTYPNGDYSSMQVKLRYDSYDFAVAKTWILAGLPQDIIDSTTSEKDIPEQYKEFCYKNKKALFAGIDRTTTDLFRSTYLEDTSEEAIESYYEGDLFYPDGTPVDEVDDDE